MYTPMVKYEEEELEKVFGQEYLEYKEKVPRWLPRLTPAKFND
jgi:protein-S-isoprenylcysteine O-methyltransferase Ste14